MTIRIFNPEHDLALASGLQRFTAPHAGRQLRSDLSFLPALWAEEGDVVVVEDIDAAETAWQRVRFIDRKNVEFCTFAQLPAVLKDEGVTPETTISESGVVCFDPWGWDPAIRVQFMLAGVPKAILPTEIDMANIRNMSSRIHTTNILKEIRRGIEDITCGESLYCQTEDAVREQISKKRNVVLKAPWSSSGRGVRYVDADSSQITSPENPSSISLWNWVRNTINQQGGIMVEPYYNKVSDFAMEFVAQSDGNVNFHGLSLFQTHKGAYTGNLLASEGKKQEILSQYIPQQLQEDVVARLEKSLSNFIKGQYVGPFGVDMMVVATPQADRFLLHPCVEVNLRRTMGHVALSLFQLLTVPEGTMQVTCEQKKYHLKVSNKQN